MEYGAYMGGFTVGGVALLTFSIYRNIKLRKFFDPRKVQYPGGFYPRMNKFEASKILNLKGVITEENITA